jgi:mRNA interferase RelE/StbE
MSDWTIEYLEEARTDLEHLNRSQQLQVLKAIIKVSANPLPTTESGLGKPLGNRLSANLAGYLEIKLQKAGLRIVYRLMRDDQKIRIIIISVRDYDTVYKMAHKRIKLILNSQLAL